ncbi:MAG: VCBS repeat-containing protein [Deltaproteobacteria bacterium]|nr:VCBS repeat-containing protein [Deltaproteobacteria bacterium]
MAFARVVLLFSLGGCVNEPSVVGGSAEPGPVVGGLIAPGCGWFEDMTARTGVHVRHDRAPFGGDGSSVAAEDLDGDGDVDLVFTQGMNNPARLYRNDGAWRFTEVGPLPNGVGVGVGDLDGDGDPDLVLTDMGRQHLLENLGEMRFRDRSAEAGVEVPGSDALPEPTTAALAADLDGDGDLDLYFAQRARSRAYRNDGAWRFADASEAWGIPARNASSTYAPAYFDATGDGVADLFVPIDTDTVSFDAAEPAPAREGDQLLVARRDAAGFAGFRDEAAARGLGGARSSMGVIVADFDGDARSDIYVSNIGANPLFRALGDGTYAASTTHGVLAVTRTDAGPCAGRVRDRECLISSWGSALFDADLDGDDDLVIAIDGLRQRLGQLHFERLADGAWRQRPSCLPPTHGLGLVAADLDGDGALDLVETTNGGPAAILRNRAAPRGRWLRVTLRGHAGNPRGVGAAVTARRAAGPPVTRWVGAHGCAYCTPALEAWFSAADDAPVDLEVRWPSGARSTAPAVRPGRAVTLEEPAAP